MGLIVFIFLCVGAAIFLVASAVRAWWYARAPIHLRWELYPVPHEDPAKVKHGGSSFEDLDHWKQPPHANHMGDLSVMVPEILFLKALHEFNRKLWYRSFPFHFGLYLLAAACGSVLLTALLGLVAPALVAGPVGLALHWTYTLLGALGMVLAMVGALGLLHSRLTDDKLRISTTPGDVFNLLFFLVSFGILGAGYLLRGPDSAGMMGILRGLLTLDTSVKIPGLLAAGLCLCALLAAYIPLTHMSHFVGKYFTYHDVRWNDQANVRGGKIEAALMEYLTYRPTWSAAHVGADGKRTWADIATTNPWEGAKK